MPSMRQLLVLAAVLSGASADAAIIQVSPGPGTPLQDAIAAAAPGDVIKLATGTYNEAVTIDKRLHLQGPGFTSDDPVGAVIDAGCAATTALDINADRVQVQHVTVRGGTFYTIDIEDQARVRLKDVTLLEGHFGCGGVEYGINVFNSTNVQIIKCTVIGDNNGYTGPFGYQDAGIYIGGIPEGGNVRVNKGVVVGNNRGIIVEDSLARGVRIRRVVLPSNASGIFVHNSDGARVERNIVNDVRGSGTTVGIEVDATSDDNFIRGNSFVDAVTDVLDNGTSNCWIRNTFATGTVPSGGCD